MIHLDLDATQMSIEGEYDAVVIKSVLGSIAAHSGPEAVPDALNRIQRSLTPDGVLLFAENLAASPAHMFLRRQLVPWGDKVHYVNLQELRQLLSPFAEVHWSSAGFLGALGRTHSQRELLGKADSLFFDWTVPRSWNYLVFGVAHKQLA